MQESRHASALSAFSAALKKKRVKVGFLGGSITAGHESVGGKEDNWPAFVIGSLVEKFPDVLWESYNAGIGGTGAISGLMRAQKEIVANGCDLVFVEYAVNDCYGDSELRLREREGLVRMLLKSGADVIFLYTFRIEMHADMAAGKMPQVIREMEELASHYGIGSVWAGLHAYRAVCAGRLTWEQWLPIRGGTLHPEAAGSLLYAEAALKFLEEEFDRKDAPLRNGLPAPLDGRNYENIRPVPFENWNIASPWTVRRELSFPWYDKVVCTSADGAKLTVHFRGRMLAAHFNFGKRSGILKYRIDGGEEIVYEGTRCEWVPDSDWCTPALLASDLESGDHVLELSVHYVNMPDCKGSECQIYTLMSAE